MRPIQKEARFRAAVFMPSPDRRRHIHAANKDRHAKIQTLSDVVYTLQQLQVG